MYLLLNDWRKATYLYSWDNVCSHGPRVKCVAIATNLFCLNVCSQRPVSVWKVPVC